jgi:AraC family transcriptional regulator
MDGANPMDDRGSPAPSTKLLANGAGWSLYDYVCRAGPEDRPFEERHEGVAIAAVVAGSFSYRSDAGTSLLYPGAFMLGNAGACYQCGHEHGSGDHCIAFQIAPDYFAEISASAARSGRFRFPAVMLPALPETLPLMSRMESSLLEHDRLALEETVASLVEAVVRLADGDRAANAQPSARDRRRIAAVLKHIEAHAEDDVGLEDLAAMATMSKYHFLRLFQCVAGTTPYQFVISCRMRRAAAALASSREPISGIAFACGFGDLSTFNRRFRATFGLSPTGFRVKHQH